MDMNLGSLDLECPFSVLQYFVLISGLS
jgi:hypothetical protein